MAAWRQRRRLGQRGGARERVVMVGETEVALTLAYAGLFSSSG